MKVILMGYLFFICFATNSQIKQEPQIFFSSKDFSVPIKQTKQIKKISRNLFAFSDHLTVKYADGTEQKVPKKNTWGYRDKRGNEYRYYNKYFYEIDVVDTIIIYRLTGRWTNIFFSKTLDSEIYKYSKRNLKKYLDEATYQKVLENKKLSRML